MYVVEERYMIYYRNDFSFDPRYNLALEEYVFRSGPAEPVLLLWRNEPSVIVGRFQNTVEEIDTDYVLEHDIHVVRRITGGGAVYHDLGNLNYSFIVSTQQRAVDFGAFVAPLVEALTLLGVKTELSGRNDVLVEGRKFSGSAQYHQKGRTLHHGTILFDSDLDCVGRALRVKPAKIESKGVKSVRNRITNLSPYLPTGLSVLQFRDLLFERFSEMYDMREEVLSADDIATIEKLKQEKYDQWFWNYGLSPDFAITREDKLSCGMVQVHLDVEHGIIRTARIFGDFFSNCDIDKLETALGGVAYAHDDICTALLEAGFSGYFPDVDIEDFCRMLL